MKGEFRLEQTRSLCEDMAVIIHRYVCRIRWRPGFEDPLLLIARKAKVPLKQVRMVYYARRPEANTEQMGAILWACEQVFEKAKKYS